MPRPRLSGKPFRLLKSFLRDAFMPQQFKHVVILWQADNVSEGKRVSAFGLLSGVVSAATVGGTLAARLLPTDRIFQVPCSFLESQILQRNMNKSFFALILIRMFSYFCFLKFK